MKHLLLLALCVAAATGSTVVASYYRWNTSKRPPISLTEAIVAAEKALGEDAKQRYCLDAWLYGSHSDQEQGGYWLLRFAAADNSAKRVKVTMQGKTEVIPWNAPIDWTKNEGRRESFADIRQRLEELFQKEGLPAEIRMQNSGMLVTSQVREYEFYPETEPGVFGDKLQKLTGPSSHGFWLELRRVDKPEEWPKYTSNPYWTQIEQTWPLGKDQYFASVLRFGREFRTEVHGQILQILGERVLKSKEQP